MDMGSIVSAVVAHDDHGNEDCIFRCRRITTQAKHRRVQGCMMQCPKRSTIVIVPCVFLFYGMILQTVWAEVSSPSSSSLSSSFGREHVRDNCHASGDISDVVRHDQDDLTSGCVESSETNQYSHSRIWNTKRPVNRFSSSHDHDNSMQGSRRLRPDWFWNASSGAGQWIQQKMVAAEPTTTTTATTISSIATTEVDRRIDSTPLLENPTKIPDWILRGMAEPEPSVSTKKDLSSSKDPDPEPSKDDEEKKKKKKSPLNLWFGRGEKKMHVDKKSSSSSNGNEKKGKDSGSNTKEINKNSSRQQQQTPAPTTVNDSEPTKLIELEKSKKKTAKDQKKELRKKPPVRDPTTGLPLNDVVDNPSHENKKKQTKLAEEEASPSSAVDESGNNDRSDTQTKESQKQPPQPQPHPHLQQTRMFVVPQGNPRRHSNELDTGALTIALAHLISVSARLWFLAWLLGQPHEVMHPTQHFIWERVMDRYERDEHGLQTALQCSPRFLTGFFWKWVQHSRGLVPQTPRQHRIRQQQEAFIQSERVFDRTVVVVDLNDQSRNPSEFDVEYLASVVTFLLDQYRCRAFGTRMIRVDDHERLGRRGLFGRIRPVYREVPIEVEVVFLLESPGGTVVRYGLAAAELQRLKHPIHAPAPAEHDDEILKPLFPDASSNIHNSMHITICVDKIACSGGYMIACQADKLIAAPFSYIGSIGALVLGLNYHDFCKSLGITPISLQAGENKNNLSVFGPITRKGIEHEEMKLKRIHEAFKDLVVAARPGLVEHLDVVADGSVFMGQEALKLNLVDKVMTSEEYILQRLHAGDRVLKLHRWNPQRFSHFLISPKDLLPHIRKMIVAVLGGEQQMTQTLGRLIQTGTLLSFTQHVVRQIGTTYRRR